MRTKQTNQYKTIHSPATYSYAVHRISFRLARVPGDRIDTEPIYPRQPCSAPFSAVLALPSVVVITLKQATLATPQHRQA